MIMELSYKLSSEQFDKLTQLVGAERAQIVAARGEEIINEIQIPREPIRGTTAFDSLDQMFDSYAEGVSLPVDHPYEVLSFFKDGIKYFASWHRNMKVDAYLIESIPDENTHVVYQHGFIMRKDVAQNADLVNFVPFPSVIEDDDELANKTMEAMTLN